MTTTHQTVPATAEDGAGSPPRATTIVAFATVLVLAALAVLAHWLVFWRLMPLSMSDLWVFREGARLIAEGSSLYSVRFAPGYWTLPPFAGIASLPLLVLPVTALFPAWTALNIVVLAGVVAVSFRPLIGRAATPAGRVAVTAGLCLAALGLTPVSETLGLGQVGLVLLALCLADVALVAPSGSRCSGVLVGLATAYKLTPGLFIVHFAVTRQWRAAVTAAATAAGCWTITALVLPSDMREYLLGGVILRTNQQIDGFGDTVWNQSLRGLLDGIASPWSTLLWALASLLVVAAAVVGARAAHRAGNHVAVVGLLGLATVLISPISWHHHATWLIPALAGAVGDGRRMGRVYLTSWLALALMASPREAEALPDRFVVLYAAVFALLLWVVTRPAPSTLSSSPERYYDDAYERVMYTGVVGWYSRWAHSLLERPFRRLPSGRVLEVGAGAGQHASYVAHFDSYLETDISVPAGDVAVRHLSAGPVERRRLDAQDLSGIPDGSIDRVIATCLLAHLDQPGQALSEWRRVTRPGGTISIYVPAEPGMLLRLVRRVVMVPKSRALGQDHERTVYLDHRNHYPGMRSLIAEVFADDDVRRRRYPVPFVGWNLSLFDVVHVRRSER